jgi:anti-anti-sigma regulatory factor
MLETTPDTRVIALEGRVDPEEICMLERRIAGALADGHRRIVVDLTAVTLLVLPALSPFCRVLRHATRDGATVAIVGGHPHVRRTIELRAIWGVELRPTESAKTLSQPAHAR